ncbi:MAG: hypothetical protein ACREBG_22930 [Pyrinomonadaceae bacterium]
MMVRFATLCDSCGKRSCEYEAWPSCLECDKDTCSSCDVPAHRTDADLNKPERTLCQACVNEPLDRYQALLAERQALETFAEEHSRETQPNRASREVIAEQLYAINAELYELDMVLNEDDTQEVS